MSKPIETDNSKERLLERIKTTPAGSSEKLMMQADFFADAISAFMPCQPDIWNGGSKSKGQPESKNMRLCWHNPKNDRYIELILSDSYAGSLWVCKNRTSIKWLSTEKGAMEAFKSAFNYVYGE